MNLPELTKNIRIALFVVFIFAAYSVAQSIQPRNNFNSLLEPAGKIIIGAGQLDITSFSNYWNVMNNDNKPAIFMTYIQLKGIQSNWSDSLKEELLSYGSKFIIPQIGLTMTEDGNPSVHYEGDVAAGLYDKEIDNLIAGLRKLAIPVYLRIGFEFNGFSWNGYQPETYKAAFNRITARIRAGNLGAATVWCFSMDGQINYMDYYPGDSTVDWWGIDIFSAGDFSASGAMDFMDSAFAHQKPVMLGETTPRYVGVLNGQQSWNDWFVPFFNFIHNQPSVKAFCYINWDWSQYPKWSNWGDARLEMNSVVAGNFTSEMDSTEYLGSSGEGVFRKELGIPDNTAPQTPQNISLITSAYPLKLSWDPVTDPSGLSHYIIYKNGALSNYTLETDYSDYDYSAGDTINYSVTAMDRAGNESTDASITAYIPDTVNKSLNGGFENGKEYWDLYTNNSLAEAVFEIDSVTSLEGNKSAKITVNQSSGNNEDIQLAQSFKIYANHKYKIEFTGKSSAVKTIDLVIRQPEAPYQIYLEKEITLTADPQTFSDSVFIDTTDLVNLEFYLGSPGTGNIRIDDVSMIESLINKIRVNVKVLLQGPNIATTSPYMSTTLNTDGYLQAAAANQPYNSSPWTYTGNESVGSGFFGAHPSIVDWVLIQLRTGADAAHATTVVGQRAAFLKSDGTVVDLDGTSPVSFSGTEYGTSNGVQYASNYYIVIKHRNHLAVMSNTPASLTGGNTLSYDFTGGGAYGTNAMASLGGGKYGMWAGDVNGNGTITYSDVDNDRLAILTKLGYIQTTTVSGYFAEDTNMDGTVQYSDVDNDRLVILSNLNYIQTSSKSTQVP